MSVEGIHKFRNIHKGKDVYVLAGGPSMGYIKSAFFDCKITVGVNGIFRHIKSTYLLRKEYNGSEEAIESGIPLITSEHNCGSLKFKRNIFNKKHYIFKHLDNAQTEIDLAPLDTDDMLVVSRSTITSAIHFAYYLGAKCIILCGHDCGSLDSKTYFDNYNLPDKATRALKNMLLRQIEPQTIKLVTELRNRGIGVHSLNPFINFGLEGHVYQR